MRRYDAQDISEHHYRALRLLIQLKVATAYLVVKCDPVWPPPISYSPRQAALYIAGDAIN